MNYAVDRVCFHAASSQSSSHNITIDDNISTIYLMSMCVIYCHKK